MEIVYHGSPFSLLLVLPQQLPSIAVFEFARQFPFTVALEHKGRRYRAELGKQGIGLFGNTTRAHSPIGNGSNLEMPLFSRGLSRA